MRRSLGAAALTAGLAIGLAGTAQAATVLGGDLSQPATNDVPCDTTCLTIQETLPGAQTASPHAGVITKWRVRGSGPLGLAVVRYSGADTIVMGATATGEGNGINQVTELAARLPIAAGDHVGLVSGTDAVIMVEPAAGADADAIVPSPAAGATATADPADLVLRVAYNAVVEPDADGDGFGDETQDSCPTDPATQGACAPAPDTTAPTIGARLSPRSFKARRGTTLTLSASEAASVTTTLARRVKGRKRGRKCVAGRRSGRRCTFYKRVKTITGPLPAGSNSARLRNRIAGVRLRRGRYRLTFVGTDAAGNRSRPARVTFRVR